jgi:CpeT/CpcT family protein DUF1001
VLAHAETVRAGTLAADAASWLSGTFVSKAAGLRYVGVIVPKSRLSTGAPVLYVEEARVDRPEEPFLQRFYRVEEPEGGTVLLRVFEPLVAKSVTGKWRDPETLALYGSSDVRERTGCLIALKRREDRFEGGNEGRGCPFGFSGARYLVTRVRVSADHLELMEQGVNGSGTRVFGPEDFVAYEKQPPAK